MPTHRFIRTETLRLSELQVQDLVNTPLEARFNRLARITREALQVRAAAVSLLDREREWFKAVTGWYAGELPLSRSLVACLLQDGEPVIVGDTTRDPRCRDHPLVIGQPAFRFCAVYPLRDRFGKPAGALAGYDLEPRRPTARMAEVLSDLGELAQREILVSELGSAQQELLNKLDISRRQAMLDDLTRLWNRRGGLELLQRAMKDTHSGAGLGILMIDVDRFKQINDTHGHGTGDSVLRKVAGLLIDSIRVDDIACRLGGDEFLVVLPDISRDDLAKVAERIRARADAVTMRSRAGTMKLSLSIGGFACASCKGMQAEELLGRADAALYEAKAAGRNHAVLLESIGVG